MLIIRASSFNENFPQISAKPIAFQRNGLGKLSQNRPFFTIISQRNWPRKFPQNSREIGRFFHEFAPENPTKFDIFSRDLPEALYIKNNNQTYKWIISSSTKVDSDTSCDIQSAFLLENYVYMSVVCLIESKSLTENIVCYCSWMSSSP